MGLTIRTARDLDAAREEAEHARRRAEAQRYLAETDWMVIRAVETGKPVAEAVAASRAGARQALVERPIRAEAERTGPETDRPA